MDQLIVNMENCGNLLTQAKSGRDSNGRLVTVAHMLWTETEILHMLFSIVLLTHVQFEIYRFGISFVFVTQQKSFFDLCSRALYNQRGLKVPSRSCDTVDFRYNDYSLRPEGKMPFIIYMRVLMKVSKYFLPRTPVCTVETYWHFILIGRAECIMRINISYASIIKTLYHNYS